MLDAVCLTHVREDLLEFGSIVGMNSNRFWVASQPGVFNNLSGLMFRVRQLNFHAAGKNTDIRVSGGVHGDAKRCSQVNDIQSLRMNPKADGGWRDIGSQHS